ncbi:MAG: helix-turn-helix domain containing protein [Actinomycetia bacterium]|nr:helix-turn-helix domain containing protein [Actinomycetes bacterium]
MEGRKGNTAKRRALDQNATLNKNADKVADPKFKNIAFFDPDDLLQVKYEMLRSAQKDGTGVIKASKTYGFSRITFYKVSKAFKESGLVGLIPQKKGPRRAHKLTGEVMEFVKELIRQKPGMRSSGIKEEIKERFSITVHKRSIERAILRSKKKHPKT